MVPLNYSTNKIRSFDDIPQDELFRMAVKLYIIGALVWDYTDTVLDICVQMRIHEVKKLARVVRELHKDYDYRRSLDLDREHISKEWKLAELFEQINKDNLTKLCIGLRNEIYRMGLDEANAMLVEAVQMAMTVLDTMRLYAAQCNRFIRRYYPAKHSILPEHFSRLAILLPEFAGDCYDENSPTRRLTAKILLNELNGIELCGVNEATDITT